MKTASKEANIEPETITQKQTEGCLLDLRVHMWVLKVAIFLEGRKILAWAMPKIRPRYPRRKVRKGILQQINQLKV